MAPTSTPTLILNNKVAMPMVGLGTYKAQGTDVKQSVLDAIDIGYRHIDTADYYQNLGPIGEAIRESIAAGKVTRAEVFLTTKVFSNHYGEGRVIASVKRMLTEAGLDYFDLVLLHWPMVFVDDDEHFIPLDANGEPRWATRPLTEIYKELEQAYDRKWARAIGVSNFNEGHLKDILAVAKVTPTMNQVECHPYLQQRKLKAYCEQHNINLTAYCPLGAAGNHPGTPNLLQDPVLAAIAAKHGKSPAQVSLRWLLDRNVVVIPKSVRRERLEQNIDVLDFQLTPDERAQIDQLDKGARMVNPKIFKLFD